MIIIEKWNFRFMTYVVRADTVRRSGVLLLITIDNPSLHLLKQINVKNKQMLNYKMLLNIDMIVASFSPQSNHLIRKQFENIVVLCIIKASESVLIYHFIIYFISIAQRFYVQSS